MSIRRKPQNCLILSFRVDEQNTKLEGKWRPSAQQSNHRQEFKHNQNSPWLMYV